MRQLLWLPLFLSWLPLVAEAADATPTRPNVLLIAIDDLRCDLGAYGVAYAKSPQLDGFAKTARTFTRHYVQVPTCGASRCALLRGRYPTLASQVGNGAISATNAEWGTRSLPAVFKTNGYQTLALGKITHHPGGLTGKDWAAGPEELPGAWDRSWVPDGPWKTPVALMHGYANGVARKPGVSPPFEVFDGPDEAYPDAWVAAEAVTTLGKLAAEKRPWFFSVGFFKPHLPFAAPKKWHDLHAAGIPDLPPEVAAKPSWPSGWHNSGELRGNYGHPKGVDAVTDPAYVRQLRQAYTAGVSYMDAQVGRVLAALKENGLDQNTIVVIWSDHGFLLGEHGIIGKHCLYEDALRSPLMIRFPGLKEPGKASAATVETVDLFPTLTDLCGLPKPKDLDGASLRPQLDNPAAPSTKPAHSFWTGGQRTIRTDRWRLVDDGKGIVELFDYQTDPHETKNHAEAGAVALGELRSKLATIPVPAPGRASKKEPE